MGGEGKGLGSDPAHARLNPNKERPGPFDFVHLLDRFLLRVGLGG